MSLSLYKATELAAFENFIDTETGEIDLVGFEGAQITLQERARAVIAYIKNQDVMVNAIKQAETDLSSKRKDLESKSAMLKTYLLNAMKVSNMTEIQALDGTFKAKLYIDRDESVFIEDGVTFPLELCNPPKAPEPSKTLIKEAILKGEPVKGAKIIKKDRLEIK